MEEQVQRRVQQALEQERQNHQMEMGSHRSWTFWASDEANNPSTWDQDQEEAPPHYDWSLDQNEEAAELEPDLTAMSASDSGL
jgi:hypothetical protein